MANTSGLSEGSHDADDFAGGTAVAPEAPGASAYGVLGLGAIGADGSVAGEPMAAGAVKRAAGRGVAMAVPRVAAEPGTGCVTSTFTVARLGVCPLGTSTQPDNKTSAETSRNGTAARAKFLDVLGWVNMDILLLFRECAHH